MSSINGFVLAGGLGRRMGRSKGGMTIGGVTLIERAARVLSAVADPVVIVGNDLGDTGVFQSMSDEDIGGGARGAIVGLYTALLNCRAEWAAVLACDLPFVSGELLMRMLAATKNEEPAEAGTQNLVLCGQSDGRIQPLCGLYRAASCLHVVKLMLNEGNWRLQELAARLEADVIAYDEIAGLSGAEYFFDNLNTPADFEAAQRHV
ncbi:molybdenum cofactor guanylyltransferase [soil metagenome]